jgi:hypothetical protein
MEKMNNTSGVFLIDMDEVLVDISPATYKFIRNNWRRFNQYFKDLGNLSDKEVINRDHFFIDEVYIKDEYKQNKEIKKMIVDILVNEFFSSDLYVNLEPTEFAKRTLLNPVFISHSRVKKVYILTRYINDDMLKSKEKFVNKYFKHPKIEMIAVPRTEKKSDYVKKHNINWNIFIDDELKNILDFVENLDINGKEFLIPKTGYNKMPLALDLIIKEKGAVVNYFDKEIV